MEYGAEVLRGKTRSILGWLEHIFSVQVGPDQVRSGGYCIDHSKHKPYDAYTILAALGDRGHRLVPRGTLASPRTEYPPPSPRLAAMQVYIQPTRGHCPFEHSGMDTLRLEDSPRLSAGCSLLRRNSVVDNSR